MNRIDVARAIETIQAAVIVEGSVDPRTELDHHMRVIAQGGAPLRAFQAAGISSKKVAEALHTGVLSVKGTPDLDPKAVTRAAKAMRPWYKSGVVRRDNILKLVEKEGREVVLAAAKRIDTNSSYQSVDRINEILAEADAINARAHSKQDDHAE